MTHPHLEGLIRANAIALHMRDVSDVIDRYSVDELQPMLRTWADELEAALAALPGGAVDVPDGSWLWCKLMDWCKARRVAPAEYNDLFAIAAAAHKLNTPTPNPHEADRNG